MNTSSCLRRTEKENLKPSQISIRRCCCREVSPLLLLLLLVLMAKVVIRDGFLYLGLWESGEKFAFCSPSAGRKTQLLSLIHTNLETLISSRNGTAPNGPTDRGRHRTEAGASG